MDDRLRGLFGEIYTPICALDTEAFVTPEPVMYAKRSSGEHKKLNIGDKWGELWDCAWMHMRCDVPDSAVGLDSALLIDVGGEACIFDENGVPYKGLTNKESFYSFELGMPGKVVTLLEKPLDKGQQIDIWLDCGANDLFGEAEHKPPTEPIGVLHRAELCAVDNTKRSLYYDLEVISHLADATEDEALKAKADECFETAITVYKTDIERAKSITNAFLSQKSESDFKITALGHAHIDLAWLWPLRETRRKAARTFATLMRNTKRYPEYLFGVSQPQMLLWVKEDYPELYEELKQLYADKRLELQGGFWVESDTNIPTGESLVRQMLYSKKFFKEEFGYEQEILWLPDVFGYNAQLPQIMAKSGIKYFLTIKLSWNSVNKFPHSTFNWVGLDGSTVLTHMPPEGNYNSAARAESLLNIEKNFREKDIDNRAMMLYGIGDGGGGPGMEHLERLRREYDLAGLPRVKQGFAVDFFRDIERDKAKFPSYRGELYLEKHQGTYTTQARNKRFNRLCENALRETEIMSTVAHIVKGLEYPKDKLEEIWKEILLYQFHDLIPGSSIKRVYDESCDRYYQLFAQTEGITNVAFEALADNKQNFNSDNFDVFNPSPFDFKGFVNNCDNDYVYIEAPAFGFGKTAKYGGNPAVASLDYLENEHLRVTFNAEGGIASVFGKEDGFEYLRDEGNVIISYQDTVNAWEVPADYAVNPRERAVLQRRDYRVCNGVAEIIQVFSVGESSITQKVRLAPDSRRIDFATNVDWRETHRMLRSAFPLNIQSDEARCDIQYGDIRRPTHTRDSFAKAKKEICAHKWVDISDDSHGSALLNDCKYGYRVWDCVLDIDLLRSSMYPGVDADKGQHDFTYSFYPHKGNYVNQVVREGYFLNNPPDILYYDIPEEFQGRSIAVCDTENVAIDWVKMSEDGSGIIVRAYEFEGKESSAHITLGEFMNAGKPILCDLMENEIGVCGETVKFKPYEIITLKFPINRVK